MISRTRVSHGHRRFSALLAAMFAAFALSACEQEANAPSATPQETTTRSATLITELPRALREVSGLALGNTGGLFAIADEVGRIMELDSTTGAVLRQIDIGRPVVRGDFEGLAVDGSILTAVTSDGIMYRIDARPEQSEATNVVDLNTREQCEIEGLSNADESGALWLICKRTLGDGNDDSVRFLRWSPEQPSNAPEQFDLANRPILEAIDKKKFNPSAIALTSDGRGLLVIAARQQSFALFSLTNQPEFVLAAALPDAPLHEQAEGLAIDKDGRVFVANEGATGQLFAYPNQSWSKWLTQESAPQ